VLSGGRSTISDGYSRVMRHGFAVDPSFRAGGLSLVGGAGCAAGIAGVMLLRFVRLTWCCWDSGYFVVILYRACASV
jgi:hypothetical protein